MFREYRCSILETSYVTQLHIINWRLLDYYCVCTSNVLEMCIFQIYFPCILVVTQWNANHKSEKYRCPFCVYATNYRTNFEAHKRTHTGERPFICIICRKGFTQKEHLKIHFQSHTGERPFACMHCNQRFAKKVSLKAHKCVQNTCIF